MAPTDLLHTLSDDELLRRLASMLGQSRCVEADLVAHIGEVDGRRLYLREACSSMFSYCTERLHLSEAEAYLRITVARASRRHPALLSMLADGRLHLSGAARVGPLLSEENRDSVLARAAHASKRQLLELAALLRPLPDAPASVRKLPQRQPAPFPRLGELPVQPAAVPPPASLPLTATAGGGLCPERVGPLFEAAAVTTPVAPQATPLLDGVAAAVPAVDTVADRSAAAADAAREPVPAGVDGVRPPQRGVVEPLAPGRYKVTFTASAGLREKLERLQELMASSVPDGDIAAVIEEAVTEKLQRLLARRFAVTETPRSAPSPEPEAPSSRHVPAAVRRAAYLRDGGRCAFVDRQGRRCTERRRLELHHRHPFGYGGRHRARDCQLLCEAHHAYVTGIDFGRDAKRGAHRGQAPAGASEPKPPAR